MTPHILESDRESGYAANRRGLKPVEPLSDDDGIMTSVSVYTSGSVDDSAEAEPQDAVPCQYIDAAELEGKSGVELAEVFSRPTIVRGLIDDWGAHARFGASGGLKAFAEAFVNHSFLSKRVGFARERCAVRATTSTCLIRLPHAPQSSLYGAARRYRRMGSACEYDRAA